MKTILLIIVITLSTNTYSNGCLEFLRGVFKNEARVIKLSPDADEFSDSRKYFADILRENNIPAFTKKDPQGNEIPYVLINRDSAKKLKSFIENSYGTQIVLQPNYNNDHGLLRIGANIVDVDLPGARGFGELHQTGIAWKNVDEYLKRRNSNSYKILEVTYLLTPEENKIIEYYQRVRRAAIFRVPFTFGGNRAQKVPFMLGSGGEHCFIFCKSTGVSSHINEIAGNLKEMGVSDPDAYIKQQDVAAALDSLAIKLNALPDSELSPDRIGDPATLEAFKKIFPDEVQSQEDKIAFIRWLVSYDSSSRYSQTLKNLGVTSDFGTTDAQSKRATAVFIYDEGADPEAFSQGVYETNGKSYRWPQTGQSPL